jgi:hypothetical protein
MIYSYQMVQFCSYIVCSDISFLTLLLLSIYGSTDLDLFFSFLMYTQLVGLLGRGISPSQGHYLHTEHKQNKHTQTSKTSMPQVGFEPTIPLFE